MIARTVTAKRLRVPSCPSWLRQKTATTKDTLRLRSGQAPVHEGKRTFLRWLKFNFVGGIGIAVQLAVLALLRSALHVDYLVATIAAVELAVLHNFLWHERFTWADRRTNRLKTSMARLARFNLSSGAVSIVGNLLLMRLLVGQFRIHYIVANLIAIAACSIANFLLSDRLVFRPTVQSSGMQQFRSSTR